MPDTKSPAAKGFVLPIPCIAEVSVSVQAIAQVLMQQGFLMPWSNCTRIYHPHGPRVTAPILLWPATS